MTNGRKMMRYLVRTESAHTTHARTHTVRPRPSVPLLKVENKLNSFEIRNDSRASSSSFYFVVVVTSSSNWGICLRVPPMKPKSERERDDFESRQKRGREEGERAADRPTIY